MKFGALLILSGILSVSVFNRPLEAATSKALSSMPLSVSTNGWGPLELNMSNGESGSRDGKPIQIGGLKFSHGIGTHAPAAFSVNLQGKASGIIGYVGLDDAVGNNGSASVLIYADNKLIFNTNKMTGRDAAVRFSLNLTRVGTLKFVVDKSDNGTAYDWVSFGDVRILYGASVAHDLTSPMLSSLSIKNITSSSAEIAWKSNEAVVSRVKYGTTSAVDQTTSYNDAPSASARVVLQGLQANKAYYYQIVSRDLYGNIAQAKVHAFKTLATSTINPPNNPIAPPANSVNILSHGAVANDGKDDSAAILRAANAAGTNGTVFFPAGTFNVSNQITLPGNRAYKGASGSKLKGLTPEGPLVKASGDGFIFEGMTFDGGGVFMDKAGSFSANNIFRKNTFRLTGNGKERNGINFTCGFRNTLIEDNYFTSIDTGGNHSFGLYGYNYDTFTVRANTFEDIGAGMHIDAFGNSKNLLVEQNYLKGVKGMGLEFQGSATNLKFLDNWYEDPSFVARPGTGNNNTFAYSLILDKSSGIQIKRNVMIAPLKNAPSIKTDYVRVSFEIGGDDAIIEDNYSKGGNHVVAMNDGVGSASVTVRNNKFINYAQGVSCSFCTSDRSMSQSNNGDIRLSDVMEARIAANKKPGVGKRY